MEAEFWYMAFVRFSMAATNDVFLSFSEELCLRDIYLNKQTSRWYNSFNLAGVWLAGYCMSNHRNVFSPKRFNTTVVWANLYLHLACLNLCNWPGSYLYLQSVSAILIGAVEVSMCCFVNERFNKGNFAIVFGVILSFGSIGNVFTDFVLDYYIAPEAKKMRQYGMWNVHLFTYTTGMALFGLLMMKLAGYYIDRYRE